MLIAFNVVMKGVYKFMNKRVLLISQYFLPDINAASFRMNDLYHALLEEGYEVTVITAEPQKFTAGDGEQSPQIHRLPLSKVKKKSFFHYIENYFGFMFKSVFYATFKLRQKKYDYVIATSPPLFAALGGFAISFLKRAKFILDIRDIWPDSAVSAGMLNPKGVPYKLARIAEKFIYRKANIITCVSRPMGEYICSQTNHKRVHVLYNGISPSSLVTESKLQSSEPIKRSHLTVGYAGNIGIVQNTDILLKASQLLGKDNNSIQFLMIGDGVERGRIEAEAVKLEEDSFVFTGILPKQEALSELEKADLLFFSLIEDPTFDITIPSKLFDYLLLNKPIITSIKGEGREILEKLGCAIFFDPNSPQDLIRALQEYDKNRDLYNQAALGNREFARQTFNRRTLFREFFSQLN